MNNINPASDDAQNLVRRIQVIAVMTPIIAIVFVLFVVNAASVIISPPYKVLC